MKKRNDGRYRRYITIDGKRKAFYGTSQREVNEKIKDFLQNSAERIAHGELFRDVREEWWEMHTPSLSPTTVKGYTSSYNKAVDRFGDEHIKDISIKEVSDYVNSLGVSKKSRRNHLSVLSLIFEYAIIYYGLENNPCDHVVISQGAKTNHRRALTEREVSLIQANTEGLDGLFRNMLLLTGLRRGELLALQYKDIDREKKCIYVTKSVWYEGNAPHIKTPKTDAGNRRVVLLDSLAKLIPEGSPSHYIFSDDGGKSPMHNKSSATLWNKYAKRIGLDGITPHYLRHNYATMLYNSGVDVKTAQFLLGHADIQTTMNIYTHVSEDMLTEALEKLNNS